MSVRKEEDVRGRRRWGSGWRYWNVERESTRSRSEENSLWKRRWTCHKTEHVLLISYDDHVRCKWTFENLNLSSFTLLNKWSLNFYHLTETQLR